MRDGQYRLLWTGISDSKKMKAIKGTKTFRLSCHLVYTWLLPWADDEGRMPGEPLKILANIVPNEDFTLKEIEEILKELTRVNLIVWYEIENERFVQVLDWEKYQRVRKDRMKSSIYPSCQPLDNQMSTDCPQNANLILSPSPTQSLSPTLLIHFDNNWFQKFWQLYPTRNGKKVGKKECEDYFKQNFNPNDFVPLLIATQNYSNSKTARDNYAKDPIRFIKKDFWRDWIEPPEKEVPAHLRGLKKVWEEIENGKETILIPHDQVS